MARYSGSTILATVIAASTAAGTQTADAQQIFIAGCEAIPLAGICIATDPVGNRITYDLDSGRVVKVEPSLDSRVTGTVRAPQRIGRAPLEPQVSDPAFPPERRRIEDSPSPSENPVLRKPEPEPKIETAAISKPENPDATISVDVAQLQVLLDRNGMSPGVIDGVKGSNLTKALNAYKSKTGRDLSSLTAPELSSELEATGGDAIGTYTIAPEDVAGPFVAAIPVDYAKKAELPAMSFTSAREALAEKFHMDENYLQKLNPGVDFSRPGTVIRVAKTGMPETGKVTRIEADKNAEQVRAYDANGDLVVAYPATIGSDQTPSPSGSVVIERIAIDPNYTYNPKINFTQGDNKQILTIPPGPNGPVGSVWLALSKPTYGIHGTPEPARIGKTNSHGCVRLTNWDARELAGMVSQGVTVQFLN